MDFKEGDRILFPDPLADDAMTLGKFHEVIVGEPISVPLPGGGTRLADAAWVSRLEDSTTARVPYHLIKPAPPTPEG
jgi:hypothetical protein